MVYCCRMENLPLGRAEDDSTGLVHCKLGTPMHGHYILMTSAPIGNKKNRKGKLPVRKNASVKSKYIMLSTPIFFVDW